ncbi:MAG: TrmH family RNA methyltransferase [Patescibacteria group bacterium UBA2163]
MDNTLYLIINDVRSTHNVGSLFRTADGMGVKKVFLTGYTPHPVDRFGRKDMRIAKVALGAEESLAWESGDIDTVITSLKEEGVTVVALEQTPGAVSLAAYTAAGDTALIVGNEIDGVSETVCALADAVVEIPMKGKKESLNVSNAGAIALFHFSNRS